MRSNVSSHISSYPLILHYSLLKSLEIVSTFLRLFFSITFSLLFLIFFSFVIHTGSTNVGIKKRACKIEKKWDNDKEWWRWVRKKSNGVNAINYFESPWHYLSDLHLTILL